MGGLCVRAVQGYLVRNRCLGSVDSSAGSSSAGKGYRWAVRSTLCWEDLAHAARLTPFLLKAPSRDAVALAVTTSPSEFGVHGSVRGSHWTEPSAPVSLEPWEVAGCMGPHGRRPIVGRVPAMPAA